MNNDQLKAALASKLQPGASFTDEDLHEFALGVEWANAHNSIAPASDTVRVLRLVEYVGPRDWVETTLSKSIKGRMDLSTYVPGAGPKYIQAATLTAYPEILPPAPAPAPAPADPNALTSEERIQYRDDLLAWAYSKMLHGSFARQEDALQLDRIKLLVERGIEA